MLSECPLSADPQHQLCSQLWKQSSAWYQLENSRSYLAEKINQPRFVNFFKGILKNSATGTDRPEPQCWSCCGHDLQLLLLSCSERALKHMHLKDNLGLGLGFISDLQSVKTPLHSVVKLLAHKNPSQFRSICKNKANSYRDILRHSCFRTGALYS